MTKKHKGPKGKGLGHLKIPRDQIRNFAREYGLDFFATIFEFLDFEEMNIIAAYGGFPNRYPHWRFGMEYEHLRKSYRYGLHRIYEMVINNDPCYAYLLESNNPVDQKLVMAHVYGHCDFFKNNIAFAKTNRKMMDTMANHAEKVRRFIDKYGQDIVEGFIDTGLSLEDLIDPHSVFIKRSDEKKYSVFPEEKEPSVVKKIPAKDYMNGFINPAEVLEKERNRLFEEEERKKMLEQERHFPEFPQKDILLFLIEYAPLEDWQREILWIIRDEAYYFAPQAETKIMNEGWATYWHEKIMTERVLTDAEIIDFADHHSGTIAPNPYKINPYRLGWQLWKDIEDRWNKGKFGKEYDDCNDYATRKSWNKKLELGREKIFEVRMIYHDINFIDEFFTEEFCRENNYYTYSYNKESEMYEIEEDGKEFERIKEKLLFKLTNRGNPFIYVINGNHENHGELLLRHMHEGRDLQITYAKSVLKGLYEIWKRPVHIETLIEGKTKVYSCCSKEQLEQSEEDHK